VIGVVQAAIFTVLALLVVTVGASCATPADLLPPVGPGTQYPCGVRGVVCSGGTCCFEGDVCGSADRHASCPAGQCCFEGGDDGLTGSRATHPQHSAGL